jgi:hypothetical protein
VALVATITWSDEDEHDPYSSVIAVVKEAYQWGFWHNGQMSEDEYQVLLRLEEQTREQDNA